MWPSGVRLRVVALAAAAVAALAAAPMPAAATPWSFDASGFVFVPQDDDASVSPIFAGDRGPLHLEARYNYEDLETASAFIGRTFEFEDGDVTGSVVPVFGVVVGNTAGIAPGVNFELYWNRFTFTTESELVIELPDSDESFLYSWTEATFAPVRGLQLGVAIQRAKLEEIGLEVRRGPMLTLSRARGWLGLYWFDPDSPDDETFVLGAGFSF
jgi:hypothetical protein